MVKIQYSDEFLSEENIKSNINILWGRVLPILQHRRYLYDRKVRRNDNSDVIVALEYYISTIASGYFGGKEPQYKVKKVNETRKGILKDLFEKVFDKSSDPDDLQAIIDNITDYNDNAEFFYKCVQDYVDTGACYGLIYENVDNEIVYAHTSSLTTVAIWNYEIPAQKIGLVRYWYENTSLGIKTHLELITKDYKKHYIDSVETNSFDKFDFVEVGSKESYWDDLPIFAVENEDGMSLYSNVLTLIDKYEQVIRNNANTFQYNDDAKLKITGYTPMNDTLITTTDDEGNTVWVKNPDRVKEDEAILNAKVFYTPDNTGNIDWVIKDINDTASENHKNTCLDMALMISGVPNVTDEGFTNADNSSALEKKFFPLDQVLQEADKMFKKELLRMWEIIISRVNLKKSTQYDFRDIEVILSRNLPSNNSELTDNWLKLRGLLSDKTIIDHLPFDLDSESELAEMDTQNTENMEKNLANMEKLGTAPNNSDYEAEDTINTDNATVKKDNVKQSDKVPTKKDDEETDNSKKE